MLFCGSKSIKKNGTHRGKQRYKCLSCLRQFEGGKRFNSQEIWQLYSQGKQTIVQLALRFQCSGKTIHRHLQKASKANHFPTPKVANVVMDTTYFGRQFGVMVLFDSLSNQTLSVEPVRYETNALYLAQIHHLKAKGIEIQSITCDGRKGLLALFTGIPVQLCQFHQVKTVIRYLTRKPKSAASQDLLSLTLALKNCTAEAFEIVLESWYCEHKSYLNERTINAETGKSHYTHRRLRSAYLSLKRNLPLLFTFERYPERNIPKTTNLLESRFGDMKRKIGCHQGMKMENKILFIKDYFSTEAD